MRFALILSALAILGLAGGWLFAGRQIVLLVDRFATSPAEALPLGPFVYSPNGIAIGEYPNWTSLPDGRPADLRVDIDPSGRLVLHEAGRAFALGTRIGPPSTNGNPDVPFAPDADDAIVFTRDRSLIAWPTPFTLNFMTGSSPSWRRNLYFRLTWRKPSGATLEMAWRYEQWFYAVDGWSPSWMTTEGTGLIHLGITGSSVPDPESVEAYLARTKGWVAGDYRLETRGLSADGCCEVVRVIYRLDEAGPQPGSGRSVELHLDRATGRIEKEFAFQ